MIEIPREASTTPRILVPSPSSASTEFSAPADWSAGPEMQSTTAGANSNPPTRSNPEAPRRPLKPVEPVRRTCTTIRTPKASRP